MAKLVVPLAGQARLHWRFHTANVLWFNVFGFNYTGTPAIDPASVESLFTAIKGAFSTNLALTMTDTRLLALGLRDVRTESQAEVLSTSAFVGSTSAAPANPRNVSMVTTLRTAKAGRQWRGRLYLSGWDTGYNTTEGVSGPGAEVAALNFWNAVKDAFENAGWTWALLQRELPERKDKQGNTLPLRPAHAESVTQLVATDDVWDTQRRRLH